MSDKPKDDDWGMTMPHMRFEKDHPADDFSDDFAPNPYSAHQPPTDEWGATQPNFNLPKNQSSSSDFDKTTPNINIPKDIWDDDNPLSLPPPHQQSSADDWGMTQPNFNPPRPQQDDWGATAPNINIPKENKPADWGATAPNIVVPQENKADDWGMSAPNIDIPAAEKKDQWSMPAPVFRISEGEKVDNLPKRDSHFDRDETIGSEKPAPDFNFSEVSPPGMYGANAPSLAIQTPSISESPVSPVAQGNPAAEKSGGSKLIYALGGLIGLLLVGIAALAGTYFFLLDKPETARQIETPIEEPKEPVSAAAPVVVAPPPETVLPKQVEYKGSMVLIAAGEFTMGSDTDAEESNPAHKISLPAFYIDKTEVTNAEYKKFCDATGKPHPPDPYLEKNYFTSRPNAPVVGVAFADAREYAAWAGKRLPTEAEWEKAASWDESAKAKRQFPWGSDFQKSNVAFGLSSISDVGKYPNGASPSGALDMAGNVLEWVDAFFQPYPNSRSTNAEFGEKNRIVRGGHFGSKSNDSLKTTKRIYVSPDIASGEDDEKLVAAIIGFRCAVTAEDSKFRDVLNAQSK